MRKFTLVASLLLTAMTTFADSKFGNWTLNGSENVMTNGVYSLAAGSNTVAYAESLSSQISITSDGSQVVASYGAGYTTLAKYGATSWTKNIAGTIASVIADNEGGVYVAGSFAKTLTLGDKKINGYDDSDGGKCSTFFAHFDKDGNVTALNSVVPSIDQELKDMDQYGYYSKVQCNPEQILNVDGKLYAALNFTSVITNADKSESLTAGSYTGYGCVSTQTLAIVTLNSNLGVDKFLYVLSGPKRASLGADIQSSKFAIADGFLYVVSQVSGYDYQGLFGQVENQKAYTFNLGTQVNYGTAKGYVLSKINLQDNSLQVNPYVGEYDWANECNEQRNIQSVYSVGDNLAVVGDFTGKNSFDLTKSSVGGSDVFVALIGKSDFAVKSFVQDGIDEGKKTDTNYWVNNCTASTLSDGKLYIAGVSGVSEAYSSTRYLKDKALYVVNIDKGTIENVKAGEFVTGLASGSKANQIYISSFEGGKTDLNFGLYTSTATSISSAKADKVQDTKIYNLQGQRLAAPVKGQINIVNGKKVIF